MFKVGDQVILKKDICVSDPYRFNKGDKAFITQYRKDSIVPYQICNYKEYYYWVDETEIESLRKLKLKRVLCLK